MKKKQFSILIMAAALLLASCGPAKTPESESVSSVTSVQESAASASGAESSIPVESTVAEEISSSSIDESREVASADNESSKAPSNDAYEVLVNDSEKFPPKITLSGNRDDHFIAERLCYYEGDKFFLMIDGGADLPGDIADNIALIIDTIEEKTGLTFKTSHDLWGFDNSTIDYGYNPWAGFNYGQKIPIFIKVDHDGAGYISSASGEHADMYVRELYGSAVWDSVPNFRDNPFSRNDFVNYFEFAHELTHVLTQRYATLTKIMTEGSADYFAMQVMNSLADVSDEFKKGRDHTFLSNFVKADVTEANAEELFRNDYQDLSHAERGDEYTLGRIICSYLAETYGDTFMKDYISAIEEAGFAYDDMVYNLDQTLIDKQANTFKNLFGDDVFVKFAAYYNK